MKAVLLAGGRGERLCPLTDTTPKPLVRVLNVSVLEYAIASLSKLGIREAAVTLCYRGEDIRRAIGDTAFGVKIHYFEETAPLGTAGAVRECRAFLDEDFLVLSGDALFDFDLSRLVSFHREHGALVSLALTEGQDVGEYGTVILDGARVRAFSEKPSWQGVFSNLVNCGIYACGREVVNCIGAGVQDFSKDLFPRLLEEGRGLYGVSLSGYWCDIGSPASLYQCNMDALYGKVNLPCPPRGKVFSSGGKLSFLGEGVVLRAPNRVENSVLGAGVCIEGATVLSSVLGDGCTVKNGAVLRGVLAANNVCFERDSLALSDACFGEGARVSQGASVYEGARVASARTVEEAARDEDEDLFVYARLFRAQTPSACAELFLRMGRALASLSEDLLLCYTEDKSSSRLFSALAAGFADGGKDALFCTVETEEQARFLAAFYGRVCAFVTGDESVPFCRLCLFDEYGLIASDDLLRRAQKAFEKQHAPADSLGVLRDVKAQASAVYRAHLRAALPANAGLSLSLFEGAPQALRASLRDAGVVLTENSNALGVECLKDTLRLFWQGEPLADAALLRAFLLSRDDGVSRVHFARVPLGREVEAHLSSRGVRLIYPEAHLKNGTDASLRAQSVFDMDYYDPAALLCKALFAWQKVDGTFSAEALRQELSRHSPFSVCTREYRFDKEKSASLFARLHRAAEEGADGLRLSCDGGVSHLYPEHGRVRILTEAVSAEAAAELCEFTERTLHTLMNEGVNNDK